MRKLLSRLLERIDERSREPRASFSIAGFEKDGRIKVEFSWNSAFIKKIKELGFQAETDEDTVQLFFYASSMRPLSLYSEDGNVLSSEHPKLGEKNIIVK